MRNIFSRDKIHDPELDRKAHYMKKIILPVMGIVALLMIIGIIVQPQFVLRYLLVTAIICTASPTFLFFIRRGHVKLSAYLYLSFWVLLIVGLSWTGGGIKGHGIRLLPMVVLMSGLIIGRKEIWVFGIIATLSSLVLVIADYDHYLPVKEALGQTPLVYWIISTTFIFTLCYLHYLSISELEKSLMETQKELFLRKQSEEKYRLIFESFQDVYYQTDLTGKIMIVSPSIKARAGYEPKELIGRNVSEFYNNPEKKNSMMAELMVNGSIFNYELDLIAKDGQVIHSIISSHVRHDQNGSPNGIEGTIHDITLRKRAEDMLKLQNEILYEVAFIQSHIVRRPVANVLGLLNLVNRNEPNDPVNFEIIPKLEIATKELDEVIHQIVKKTEEIQNLLSNDAH